ncbi:unnamed protein product, partial [Meganyctiphanes norvegica]
VNGDISGSNNSSRSSGSETIRRAGSVLVLPTHQTQPTHHRVTRAVSTQCVASAVQRSVSHSPPVDGGIGTTGSSVRRPGSAGGGGSSNSVGGGSSSKDSPRTRNAEFLASRAKELIGTLKSLMKNESAVKVSVDGKHRMAPPPPPLFQSSKSMKADVGVNASSIPDFSSLPRPARSSFLVNTDSINKPQESQDNSNSNSNGCKVMNSSSDSPPQPLR